MPDKGGKKGTIPLRNSKTSQHVPAKAGKYTQNCILEVLNQGGWKTRLDK